MWTVLFVQAFLLVVVLWLVERWDCMYWKEQAYDYQRRYYEKIGVRVEDE